MSFDLGLGLGLPSGGGPDNESYDVIIIGGGPAGASAAIYTARADLRTLVIDKGLTAGALGVTSKISNYPGVPGPVSGAELAKTIREQATSFGAEFITDKIVDADILGETKILTGGTGTYQAKAVVLATGSMGRVSVVPGEDEYLGRGVSYCATCDGAFFRNQPVAVVGNNDEALEEALFLTKFTDNVNLISPTPHFKASPELVARAETTPAIKPYMGVRLKEVVGNGLVQGVRIHPRGGEETILPVNGAFIYLQGAKPIVDYLGGRVETAPEGCLTVDSNMQTSVPGVFAVGDLLCSHIKQAVIAAADGVLAALGVDKYINGRDKFRQDWS
jgi:thioredoxin reductase (NADPH)